MRTVRDVKKCEYKLNFVCNEACRIHWETKNVNIDKVWKVREKKRYFPMWPIIPDFYGWSICDGIQAQIE